LLASKNDANVKINNACFYCGKIGHYATYCLENKYNESKHRNRRPIGQFVDRGETMHDDLRLFLSDVALLAKTDDSNAWFVDSSASIHMSCNKDWFENYHENDNGATIYLGDD
jgi:hypothetical protein